MTTNSGAHNFPTAQWGGHIKAHVTPELYVATGVYFDNPNAGDSNAGFDLRFAHTGEFVPVELGWHTGINAMPGDYKLGAYYNSVDTPDFYYDINGMPAGLTGAPFMERNGRWGGYAIASQGVYRAPDTPRNVRLGILGGIGGIGDRATARYSYFWIAGGVWQGTFPGRTQDFVSFLAAYARTNPRLIRFERQRDSVTPGSARIQTYEGIIEIGYGSRITPWLALRPNLQYVIGRRRITTGSSLHSRTASSWSPGRSRLTRMSASRRGAMTISVGTGSCAIWSSRVPRDRAGWSATASRWIRRLTHLRARSVRRAMSR